MSNANLNKGQLRQAMRAAGLPYVGLNTDAMRAALDAVHVAQVDAEGDVAAQEVQEEVLPELTEAQYARMGAVVSEAALEVQVPKVAEVVPVSLIRHALTVVAERDAEIAGMDLDSEYGPSIEAAPVAPAAPRSTSKGVKIQKDRPTQNGVKMPSEGTLCRAVWEELQRAEDAGTPHTAKTIKGWAEGNGTNTNNAAIEYYSRRKYLGISARRS